MPSALTQTNPAVLIFADPPSVQVKDVGRRLLAFAKPCLAGRELLIPAVRPPARTAATHFASNAGRRVGPESKKQRGLEGPPATGECVSFRLEGQIVRVVGSCVELKGTTGLFAVFLA
jgi:hypothetical protein